MCSEVEFCLATNKDFCNTGRLQRDHLLSPGQKYVVKEKVGKSQTRMKKRAVLMEQNNPTLTARPELTEEYDNMVVP